MTLDRDRLRTLYHEEWARACRLLPGLPAVTPRFRTTSATRRMGACRSMRSPDGTWSVASITCSRYHVDEAAAVETLRHEIAHAAVTLLGQRREAHGPLWRRFAVALGTPPVTCHGGAGVTVCPEAAARAEAARQDRVVARVHCREPGCDWERSYQRRGKVVRRPDRYRCGRCRGRLQVEPVRSTAPEPLS